MGFSLTYALEGAGWAVARIRDRDSFIDIAVSYLHDSMRELAEVARALQGGAQEGRVVFMDEPGETQLIFNRDGDDLHYEARWFDAWNSWGMGPSERFKVLLSGVTTVRRFVGEVRSQMEGVLREHGLEGYRKKWGENEFPLDLLDKLRAASETSQASSPSPGPATPLGDPGASEGPSPVS